MVLAEPPVIGSSTQQWLGPELLTLFLFHNVRSLSKSEEIEVIKQMVSTFSTLGNYWLTEQDYISNILLFQCKIKELNFEAYQHTYLSSNGIILILILNTAVIKSTLCHKATMEMPWLLHM